MRQTIRRCGVALVLAAALLATPAAWSQTPEQIQNAKALARKAVTLFSKAKDFSGAAEAFRKAYALHARPKYLWNMARSHEEGGELSAAVAAYRDLLKHPQVGTYEEKARLKIAALEPRLVGGLQLACIPDGAAFDVEGPGGTIKGRCPWMQEGLQAGEYHVTVVAEGYAPKRLTLQIAPGRTTSPVVRLTPLPGAAPPVAVVPPAAVPEPAPVAPKPAPVAPVATPVAGAVQPEGGASGAPSTTSPDGGDADAVLDLDEGTSAPGTSTEPPAAPRTWPRRWKKIAFWTAAGGLTAGLLGGAIARSKREEALVAETPEDLDAANEGVDGGNGLAGLGYTTFVLAGGAAVVFWFLDDTPDEAPASAACVQVGPGSVALEVRF